MPCKDCECENCPDECSGTDCAPENCDCRNADSQRQQQLQIENWQLLLRSESRTDRITCFQ